MNKKTFTIFCSFFVYLDLWHPYNLARTVVCSQTYLGLDVTKPVFRVSDKVRLKPVSSALETSWKLEILLVDKKVADVSAQMPRLVCAFVVRKVNPEDRFSRIEAHLEYVQLLPNPT